MNKLISEWDEEDLYTRVKTKDFFKDALKLLKWGVKVLNKEEDFLQ